MSSDRLDLVIFGASGFTGKYTVIELINIIKNSEVSKLSWGVAGRNKSKIEQVLAEVQNKTEYEVKNIPIIIADVDDEKSLNEMAKRAKVVINCCGPYRRWGEAVVKACIANKTHHVDVSGEPEYMETIQLEYNEEAKKNGVYVVSACGLDSIPADLGLVFFANNFNGEVNSVETYLESAVDVPVEGASIHYGTWDSAVHGMASAKHLGPLRRKLFPERLPRMTPKLVPRPVVHKSSLVNKWCLPFPGSDRSVMTRTQYHLYQTQKKRPIQIYTYVAFPSLIATICVSIVGIVLQLFSQFSLGRKLLLSHPKFFTGGFISHEGPTEEQAKNTRFSITFFGNGWSEKLAEPTDIHAGPPNKTLVTRVSGTNPGYGATCIALVMSAITILRESDKMPGNGGVYTPGAAFGETSLINQLNQLGIKFEIISP